MLSIALASAALLFAGPVEDEAPALTWESGPHAAIIERARREKRAMLTYFWADTDNCRRMYSETMAEEQVIESLSNMLLYSANAQSEAGRRLLGEYGLETVPALLVHDGDGEVAEIFLGFMDGATLSAELARVARGENTIPALRRKLAEPSAELEEDLAARRMLAEKLSSMGQNEEAHALSASVLERDPKGTTFSGSLAIIQREFERMGEGSRDDEEREYTARDFEPAHEVFAKLKDERGRFQALSDLGGYELEVGLMRDGIKTYAAAWKGRPKKDRWVITNALGWVDIIEYYGEHLTSKDRKFALQVAEDLVSVSELPPEPCAACEDGEEGEESCDGCSEEGDGKDGRVAYMRYRLARCLALNGKHKAAIATMKDVTELVPEEKDYSAYLGKLERSEG